jgi:hypothetical protein
VFWLEPYPDLLEGLPDTSAGPEARYEAREAMSLAFVTALQLLPPRQRAALILRDVLDFPASEVAGMPDTTEQSVTSALKRARSTLSWELPSADTEPPPPSSPVERELVARLVEAFEAAVPADPDPGQRPARVRGLPARPGQRRLPGVRAARGHPVRQPGQRDHPLRQRHAVALRPAAHPGRLRLARWELPAFLPDGPARAARAAATFPGRFAPL